MRGRPRSTGRGGKGDVRSWWQALLPVLLAVAGCGAGVGEEASRTGAQPGSSRVVVLDERPFRLVVPATTEPGTPRPLLVGLHGWGGSGALVAEQLGLAAAAERHGLLLALPDGTTDSTGRRFWNAGAACCNVDDRAVDDVDYLGDVVDAVAAEHPVDPDRVYVVGLSNGGFMAHRLACERSDLVAAVVAVAGTRPAGEQVCAPGEGVSVLQVHGTADAVIRYAGGAIMPGHPYASAGATVAGWRDAEHCRRGAGHVAPDLDADRTLPGAETTRTTWGGCDDGSAVSIWRVDGGAHVPHVTPAFGDALVGWLAHHDGAARPARR